MGIAQSCVTHSFALIRLLRTIRLTSYDLFARFGNTVTVRRNINRPQPLVESMPYQGTVVSSGHDAKLRRRRGQMPDRFIGGLCCTEQKALGFDAAFGFEPRQLFRGFDTLG